MCSFFRRLLSLQLSCQRWSRTRVEVTTFRFPTIYRIAKNQFLPSTPSSLDGVLAIRFFVLTCPLRVICDTATLSAVLESGTTWSPTTGSGVAWSNDHYVRPCNAADLGPATLTFDHHRVGQTLTLHTTGGTPLIPATTRTTMYLNARPLQATKSKCHLRRGHGSAFALPASDFLR